MATALRRVPASAKKLIWLNDGCGDVDHSSMRTHKKEITDEYAFYCAKLEDEL